MEFLYWQHLSICLTSLRDLEPIVTIIFLLLVFLMVDYLLGMVGVLVLLNQQVKIVQSLILIKELNDKEVWFMQLLFFYQTIH